MKRQIFFIAVSLALIFGLAARASAQTPAQIRIVSPRDNAIVPIGDVTVTVAVENVNLSDYHWHLYVDGELRSMIGNGVTSYSTQITQSGPHEIKAVLADEQHDELASSAVNVTAAPASPTSTVFNLSQTAPVMGALVIVIAALILIGLRVARRAAT
jgi:hypothetical protein